MNTPIQDLAEMAYKISDLANSVYVELAEDNGKRTKYYDPIEGVRHSIKLAHMFNDLTILIQNATQNIPSRDSEEGSVDNK